MKHSYSGLLLPLHCKQGSTSSNEQGLKIPIVTARTYGRMRQSNKRRLSMIKYQQEKKQLETVLAQQLAMFQQTYSEYNADGVIDAQENADLGNKLAEIMATMAQVSGGQPQQQQKSLTPQDVGLGRMDIRSTNRSKTDGFINTRWRLAGWSGVLPRRSPESNVEFATSRDPRRARNHSSQPIGRNKRKHNCGALTRAGTPCKIRTKGGHCHHHD